VSYATVTLDVTATDIGNAGLETCDDDYDGFAEFTLSDANGDILQNLPEGLEVAFYKTLEDAQLEQNQLPDQYTNETPNSQVIYIRVENNNDCFGIANMTITVNPLPAYNAVADQELCSVTPDQNTVDLSVYTNTILGSQNASDYTITYYDSQADADSGQNPITGAFTTQSNPDTVYVRVENNATHCYITSINFDLMYYPKPDFVAPTDYEVCDTVPIDNSETFDLSSKIGEITAGDTQTTVSFHLTQAAAESGTDALSTSYANIENPQTLHVRIEDENTATTGCYSLTTLELIVNQAPAAVSPDALVYCDADNDGFGLFTLTDADSEITSGDSDLVVTYHETIANAENSANALASPYNNIVANVQLIYARVESSLITTGCATIVPLTLTVNPTPQLTDPTPMVHCDDNTDGFETFDLTSKSSEILNGLDPLQYEMSFYLTQAEADTKTNAIVAPGFFTNTVANNQTIWVRVDDTSNGCYKLTSLELIVHPLPVLTQATPLELCDDAVSDGITVFDLTVKNNEITGGDGSLIISYYETQSAALAGTGAINPATAYTNTSVAGAAANPQTLFVGVVNPSTGCISYSTLTIRVLPNPTPGLTPQDLELCDDTNSGDLQEVFDLTQNETYILNGESGVVLSYYQTQADADAMTNSIADPTQYTNTSSPETIYVRDTNLSTGCYSLVSFDIIVHPLPEATTVSDYIVCELNTDQMYAFDLSSKDTEILNGQDPSLYQVSYYASQGSAASGTGALQSPYNNTSNPQTIYVVISNTPTGCRVLGMSFVIEVQESAQANPDGDPILYEVCDQMQANDGISDFDLSTLDTEVLDGQNPANYAVSYHLSQADAEANTAPLSNPYTNISNPQTIYARVSNVSTTTSVCYATTALELRVNLLPIFDLDPSYILCLNSNGTEVVSSPVMDTGLSEADYSFEWSYNSTVIAGATGSSYTATQAGNYSVRVTNTTTMCENTAQTVVQGSEPPILTAEVTSAAFSDNATIEVQLSGSGDYELSIDNGPWTTDTVFTGLSAGIHEIWARDLIGCGQARVELLVIGYPPFFTPNGDGYNDTWNIFSLSDQLESKIYIFDRYGKLLKEISPQGRGWDGIYNGALMPSSDYWFTVNYRDPNTDVVKEFRAHFTLKR
jgi:gliding motility-associated-like protein